MDLALKFKNNNSISNNGNESRSISSSTQLFKTCLIVVMVDCGSSDSPVIRNSFSSLTVNGQNFTFLPVENSFTSKIGTSILGSIITS